MRSKNSEKEQGKLALQIRMSYLFLLIPILFFLGYVFYNLWETNSRYDKMLNSVVTASEFSLDFKNDYDYETYLLIVGNKTPEQSLLPGLLTDARRVVENLEQYTDTDDNRKRLESAEKYLDNLETYNKRIVSNLETEGRYEENMVIWENDVQIVTGLVQNTINEYIYYENRELQTAQENNRAHVINFMRIAVCFFMVIISILVVYSIFVPIQITEPIEKQVRAEQRQLRKAEFELLQAQINPHFLYNTLDAIVWSAEAGNQKQVIAMVGSLSDFFRTSLNKGKEIVTVKEDLQHVTSYLEIQQIRYLDILRYEIDVPEELFSNRLPKITLQPLVENALYHGIKNKRGGGKITIKGWETVDSYYIEVADDGIGMTEERLAAVNNGLLESVPEENILYGLYNVNERIRLNLGEDYGLVVDSKYQEGTKVTVHLPKNSTEIVENQTLQKTE
ncbi:sensor histidine kinase [Pseudobutyrivibrio ruminis]|uniref:sensor histidine kinase n=1 Tax=Pseudobutyrivibrio ruminis TaxID=46206 RepID=UPI00041181F7|nr:sensor histidine kinase [Pseudobutyrivibrio ruminis]